MSRPGGSGGEEGALRPARVEDLPQILAILNEVIQSSNAIFSEQPDTLQGRGDWYAQRVHADLPVLVIERAGEVLGFASYGPFRPWPGYRDSVEHSVHVRADSRRRGVGRALLEALTGHARDAGMHVMVAAIDGENSASIALHGSLGFEHVGLMPEIAVKRGRRLDLVLMQLMLS